MLTRFRGKILKSPIHSSRKSVSLYWPSLYVATNWVTNIRSRNQENSYSFPTAQVIYKFALIFICTWVQFCTSNKGDNVISLFNKSPYLQYTSPVILHSFFEAPHIIHTNSFARFNGINDQTRNPPNFCIRPSSLFSLPPQSSKTRQGYNR